MNWIKNYATSTRGSWHVIELVIISGDLISVLLASNPFPLRPYLVQVYVVFAVIFFLLSFIFPIDRPIWQRKVYIAIELFFLVTAASCDIGFDTLMYFILAKACFFLKRRDAIFAIVFMGFANLTIIALTREKLVLEAKAYIEANGVENLISPTSEVLFSYFIEYTAISFFLTLLMFLLIAESKSRKRAEKLAKEVEILATVVERNRIARDIHDSLGHTLTTLGVQLELAQKLHGINSERATQALENAQQLADRSLSEVRNTISAIRDKDFNLEKALKALIHQFRKDELFRIQSQLKLPIIPLQTSQQIYCIIKEALYNIQKHSRASLVTINSKIITGNLIIEITDNGIGFNPEQINSGSGIKGMVERSQLINGQLKIDTAIGKGTIVQLIINNAE